MKNKFIGISPVRDKGLFDMDIKLQSRIPISVTVSDEQIQPLRQSWNPCESKNGDCSHICVLIPGAPWRSCLCPVGVRLLQDRLTCSPNGTERLLCDDDIRLDFYLIRYSTSYTFITSKCSFRNT
ncbi:Low-density lipoprotein receptor-related protein [Dirofilaria immitis]